MAPCASDRRSRAAPDHHAKALVNTSTPRPKLDRCSVLGYGEIWKHLPKDVRKSVSWRLPQLADCDTEFVAAMWCHSWQACRTSSGGTEKHEVAGETAVGPAPGRCRRQRWSRLHEVDSCQAPDRRSRGSLKPAWPQAADVRLIRTSFDVRKRTPVIGPGGMG